PPTSPRPAGARPPPRRRAGSRPPAAGAEVGALLPVPAPAGLALSPDDATTLAARAVVRHHLVAFSRVEGRARSGDVKATHDLRVATRRLRATLRLFGPVLPPRLHADAERDLSWLADGIGGVRDLDVLGETLKVR